MKQTEVEKFKALLLAKAAEIVGDVNSMEGETLRSTRSELSNMPIHMADAGSDNYDVENTLGLVDGERRLLRQISEALERMEGDTYGICQECEKPIPAARLKAIPWAEYCVGCAGKVEKGPATSERPDQPTMYKDTDDEQGQDDADGGA